MRKSSLNRDDRLALQGKGFSAKDIGEIDFVARRTKYYLLLGGDARKRISMTEAIDVLGRERWLSGLSRSTFHWTSVRSSDDGEEVLFDSTEAYS